jgi:hypothetical protein
MEGRRAHLIGKDRQTLFCGCHLQPSVWRCGGDYGSRCLAAPGLEGDLVVIGTKPSKLSANVWAMRPNWGQPENP